MRGLVESRGVGRSERASRGRFSVAGAAMAVLAGFALVVFAACGSLELEIPSETGAGAGTGDTGVRTGGPTGGGGGQTNLPPPTCEEYCAEYFASCPGNTNDYTDIESCRQTCETAAGWPAGERGTDFGNTIACRIRHAQYAAEQNAPGLHCPHAGPSGGDFCGSWCENYCYLQRRNCEPFVDEFDEDVLDLFGPDNPECQELCRTIPEPPEASSASENGDTVQCRINHLIFAGRFGLASALQHCPHGNVAPTRPCFGPVETRGNAGAGNGGHQHSAIPQQSVPAGCPPQCTEACLDVGHGNFEFFNNGQLEGCGIREIGARCGGQPRENTVTVYPCLEPRSGCMRDLRVDGAFVCVADMGTCTPGNIGCISDAGAVESCEAGFPVGNNCHSFDTFCDPSLAACRAKETLGCLPPILVCPVGQTCEGHDFSSGSFGECK